MYCSNCGNQIDDHASVCIHCGAPTQNAQYQQQYQQPVQQNTSSNQSNTLAIVGFVFAFLMPLVGLICSIIGLKNAPQFNGNGKGLAIAGIIISALDIIIYLIVIIVCVVIVGAAGSYYAIFA